MASPKDNTLSATEMCKDISSEFRFGLQVEIQIEETKEITFTEEEREYQKVCIHFCKKQGIDRIEEKHFVEKCCTNCHEPTLYYQGKDEEILYCAACKLCQTCRASCSSYEEPCPDCHCDLCLYSLFGEICECHECRCGTKILGKYSCCEDCYEEEDVDDWTDEEKERELEEEERMRNMDLIYGYID